MGRIIRLTESDLARIVRRVIREEDQINSPDGVNNNPTDYKGFASSVIGKMMPAIDSWNPLDAPEHHIIYTQVHRIDSQEKYDAVAELCKTSPVLKEKYGTNKEPNKGYYDPTDFPFQTVMAFIHHGYSTNIFVREENYENLEDFATYLRQFNPNEKVFKPKKP
jgi:hypothetical protein